tara:strand:- start:463 stop:738 length:276 start_codon:yes stop_codon:yes gene_type:complete
MATVAEVLTRATDSVTLINAINGETKDVSDMTQAEINIVVQRNVDHLETILAYAPVDENDITPDVAGSSANKSSYTTAITTGNTYISNNPS